MRYYSDVKPNDMKTLRFIFLFATLFLFLQAGSFAQKLPNIHILATGGTIAGTGTSTTGSSYRAGQVAINELISAVPELKEIANITGEQKSVPRICPTKFG